MQRECPTQVCHGCKKLGHCLRDCPAGAANKQQDSTCLVLAVEAVAESVPEVVAAAGVAVSTAQEVPKVGAVTAVSTVTVAVRLPVFSPSETVTVTVKGPAEAYVCDSENVLRPCLCAWFVK